MRYSPEKLTDVPEDTDSSYKRTQSLSQSQTRMSVPLLQSMIEVEETQSVDEEKWPVSQTQAVIVVTRTYQESKSKQRLKTIVATVLFVLFIAWLVWALCVTI